MNCLEIIKTFSEVIMAIFTIGLFYATWVLGKHTKKLDEHEIDPGDRLRPIEPPDRVRVGPLEVEFVRVTHSIPDSVALAIHTPIGTLIHTGDFKVDHTPLDGRHFDLHRFATLGSAGVLGMFADSTNIDRPGFTGSELDVVGAFEEIFTSATGMLVVATFSSSLYRIQVLVRLALKALRYRAI